MQFKTISPGNALFEIPWRSLIKPAFIIAILALSAGLGWLISPTVVFGLAAVLAGTLAFLFLTRRLELGILGILPVTFLLPWTVNTGRAIVLNSTILVLILLFGVWLLKMLVLQKDLHLVASPLNKPVMIFILCASLSLWIGNLNLVPAGQQSSIPAQIGGWLMFAFSAGGLLLVGNNIREVRWLKGFIWIFLALGSVYLAVCWRYGIDGANARFFRSGISGAIFWTMLAAVSLGQALCNRDLRWRWRLFAGAICLLSLAFGWIRGKEWLAGWLPPLIAVFVILWLHSWKLGLLATLTGGLVVLPQFSHLYASINSDTQQWSTYSRFLTWPIMLELVKVNPVFGLGPTNYFHYTHLYPLYGFYLPFNSHNQYWDIVAQTGLLGLGAFLWLAYALARLGLSVLCRARDSFTRAYAITALGLLAASLAAGMMADWFIPFLYNIGFPGFRVSILAWLFLGGLIVLDQRQSRASDAGGAK